MHEHDHNLKRLHRLLDSSGVLITFVILGVVWWFAFRPMHTEDHELANQRSHLRRFLESRDALLSAQQKYDSQRQEQSEATEQLLARIPQEPREADFLDLLSQTAADTGVTLHNFRPLSSQPGDDIGRAQIQLSGRGPFESLLQFLDRLRTAPRMNRISRLELAVADQDREGCTVELTLELFFKADAVRS